MTRDVSSDGPTPAEIVNADEIPADATRVIVAGSRDATELLSPDGLQRAIGSGVDALPVDPDAVVSGTARGVDQAGEDWADARDLAIARFPAPWDDLDHPDAVVKEGQYGRYNAAAGHIRNEWMARYADALVAVWDGESSGTLSMIRLGREYLGDDAVRVVVLGEVADEHDADLGPVRAYR